MAISFRLFHSGFSINAVMDYWQKLLMQLQHVKEYSNTH